MDVVAEYGSAAHWLYKGKIPSVPWQESINKISKLSDSNDFLSLVKEKILNNEGNYRKKIISEPKHRVE